MKKITIFSTLNHLVSFFDVESLGNKTLYLSEHSSYSLNQLESSEDIDIDYLASHEKKHGKSIIISSKGKKVKIHLTPSHQAVFFNTSDDNLFLYLCEKSFLQSVFCGYSPSSVLIKQEILFSQCVVNNSRNGIIYGASFIEFTSISNQITFSWALSPLNFGSSPNHSESVDELIHQFSGVATAIAESPSPISLMLSDGIDCHLVASVFRSNNIPIELINYNQYPLSIDLSSRIAKKSASSFGSDFSFSLYDLAQKTNELTFNKFSTNLFTASHQLNPRLFTLANIGMYCAFDSTNAGKTLLSGDTFPTSLSIKHTKTYPHEARHYNRRVVKNSRRSRTHFSYDYQQTLSSSPYFTEFVDATSLLVNNTYLQFLSICTNQYCSPNSTESLPSSTIKIPLYSDRLSPEDLLTRRTFHSLLMFVRLCDDFDVLIEYDPIICQALVKFLGWFNGTLSAITRHSSYSSLLTDSTCFMQIGTSWPIIDTLLRVRIDHLMIDFPKFHICEAFKRLNGCTYEHYLENLSVPSNTISTGMVKIRDVCMRKGLELFTDNYNRASLLGSLGCNFLEATNPNFCPKKASNLFNSITQDSKLKTLSIKDLAKKPISFQAKINIIALASL